MSDKDIALEIISTIRLLEFARVSFVSGLTKESKLFIEYAHNSLSNILVAYRTNREEGGIK